MSQARSQLYKNTIAISRAEIWKELCIKFELCLHEKYFTMKLNSNQQNPYFN